MPFISYLPIFRTFYFWYWGAREWFVKIRHRWYSRQPSPRVTPGELIFTYFFEKFNETVYLRITNSFRGGETTRGASCLTMAGWVSPAGATTFSHINTLSRLPGTIFCVPRVMWRLVFGFKTTKSTKCILKKKPLDKDRLQWSNQRKILKEKGVLRSWISK